MTSDDVTSVRCGRGSSAARRPRRGRSRCGRSRRRPGRRGCAPAGCSATSPGRALGAKREVAERAAFALLAGGATLGAFRRSYAAFEELVALP